MAEEAKTQEGTEEVQENGQAAGAAADSKAQGEGNTGSAPTTPEATQTDWEAKYNEVVKRNDDLTDKLGTLLDSVSKLIESGVRLGGQAPAEPPTRQPSKQDKQLDSLIGEGL